MASAGSRVSTRWTPKQYTRWAWHWESWRGIDPKPQIMIGMDTRESGPWIAGQVAGGLKEAGVGVRFAGVVTTPGVAFLTHTDSSWPES